MLTQTHILEEKRGFPCDPNCTSHVSRNSPCVTTHPPTHPPRALIGVGTPRVLLTMAGERCQLHCTSPVVFLRQNLLICL